MMPKPEAKSKFYIWLTTDPDKREPHTKKELAGILDVTEQTLIEWEKPFRRNHQTDEQRFKNVLDTLYEQAVEGKKTTAAELYLKATGRLVDKSEQKVSLEINADQLERARKEAETRVREEVKRLNCGVVSVPDESSVLLQ